MKIDIGEGPEAREAFRRLITGQKAFEDNGRLEKMIDQIDEELRKQEEFNKLECRWVFDPSGTLHISQEGWTLCHHYGGDLSVIGFAFESAPVGAPRCPVCLAKYEELSGQSV